MSATTRVTTHAIGLPLDRLDGPERVRGVATYAYEWPVDNPAYVFPLQAEIAVGRISGVDASAAAAESGVLAVLTHENAPRLHVMGRSGSGLTSTDDADLAILQSDAVAFRGQFVGAVIAETAEIVRHAAGLVRLDYQARAHDVELRSDRDDLYTPGEMNAGFDTDSIRGDVAVCTRVMYAAPHRRTTHRLAALDTAVPSTVRAPGEAPGMFALESAMDELALACDMDPIELRIRNEPEVDPESGLPFSSRGLVGCLREGARRFGWEQRDPTPRARKEAGWLVGTGVAASTYPVYRVHGNAATIRVGPDGRYAVLIGAADIGTGTWTTLTQIAADALDVTVADIALQIGDSTLPMAVVAGGSAGMTMWGSAIFEAARLFRARLESEYGGTVPAEGFEITAEMPDNPYAVPPFGPAVAAPPSGERFEMHAFGAQFAEVRVHGDTGEVRVPRLLGVFDAGRIINPKTARSQLLGGMTWGLSMALHEHSVLDPRFGHVVNQDFAGYHISANADVGSVEVDWLDEADPYTNPMGSKGIGELGIVGTAAAIANAVHHATGIRVRDLPITLDKLL